MDVLSTEMSSPIWSSLYWTLSEPAASQMLSPPQVDTLGALPSSSHSILILWPPFSVVELRGAGRVKRARKYAVPA